MLFHLGKSAGFDVVCDKCDFTEIIDNDDVFLVRYIAREKGWGVRRELSGPPMEDGYVYLCPTCRQREESRPA
jgi:hypothetical protein